MKKQNGITLVSLVITIIVMLILAGISLSMVMGENSVLEQAKTAVDETENSEEIERTELAVIGSYGSNGKYDSNKAFEGIKKNYNLTGITTTTNASGAQVVTGVNSKTGENITLTHNTDGSIKVETEDYTLAFDGRGKVTEKNKLNGTLADGGNNDSEPSDDYSDLLQKEGCPLKFGRAYINPADGGWIGLLPFTDGGALVGWPGFGWASDSVDVYPAGFLTYENCNIMADGVVIATCNQEGTEVYFDGLIFTLESVLFGTNDCCSHVISRGDAEHYIKTYTVNETDTYTGDYICVYCDQLAKEGSCKHAYTSYVNNMGIGKGDKVCNTCDKTLEFDCVYYQYTGTNDKVYTAVGNSAMVSGSFYKRYTARDGFPETVNAGDVFRYGDFEYCYKKHAQDNSDSAWWFWRTLEEDGWGVSIIDRNLQHCDGNILSSINNKPIITMECAFFASKIVDVSNLKIPNTVYNMNYCFEECSSLTTVNNLQLPNSVKYISYMFAYCTSLNNLSIDNWDISNIKTMQNTFLDCPKKPSWYK